MLGLIIYGTKAVTGSKGQGLFQCPACQSQQPYVHKRTRRFFTLYFIPLIPFKTLLEYVECKSCSGTFKTSVLPG
ncbi:MAG: zinc-ribbon domain-containing protein [Kofleriaceae bacterium]